MLGLHTHVLSSLVEVHGLTHVGLRGLFGKQVLQICRGQILSLLDRLNIVVIGGHGHKESLNLLVVKSSGLRLLLLLQSLQ